MESPSGCANMKQLAVPFLEPFPLYDFPQCFVNEDQSFLVVLRSILTASRASARTTSGSGFPQRHSVGT